MLLRFREQCFTNLNIYLFQKTHLILLYGFNIVNFKVGVYFSFDWVLSSRGHFISPKILRREQDEVVDLIVIGKYSFPLSYNVL